MRFLLVSAKRFPFREVDQGRSACGTPASFLFRFGGWREGCTGRRKRLASSDGIGGGSERRVCGIGDGEGGGEMRGGSAGRGFI